MTSSNEIKATSSNLYLYIYSYIKDNSKLPPINIKKSTLQYYLTTLKKARLIKKIGYGVWETIADYDDIRIKQVQFIKATSSSKSRLSHSIKANKIRSHAFIFTLRIPKIDNWKNKEEYLKKKGIEYKNHKIESMGQQIIINNKKVWLTNKSIVIHDSSDYLTNSANEGKQYAIGNMLDIIQKIETLLKLSFRIKRKYLFKVSREHHSMLHNELAKQYRQNNNKLHIYDHKGLWMWIDFSDGIDEKEVGNRSDADRILDNNIAPFYNSLKEENMHGFTPKWVTNTLAELVKDRAYYAENLKSHVAVIKQLGQEVGRVAKQVKKLDNRLSQKKLKDFN